MRVRHAPWPSNTNYQLTSQVTTLILPRKSLLLRSNRFLSSFSRRRQRRRFASDVLMTELAPKRTLRSSHSTDAKSSETPVVDDVVQPPNRSFGKQSAKKKNKIEYSFSSLPLLMFDCFPLFDDKEKIEKFRAQITRSQIRKK